MPNGYVSIKLKIEMKQVYLTLGLVLLSICLLAKGKKESISFKSGDVKLAGTIYIPDGEGPFSSVVFVHGSGPETAENSSYSAKWMSKNGFVALTFDKRGAGESEGTKDDWSRFSFDSLAKDVVAAIDYLKTRSEVNPGKIGLFASSQGGWVASLVTHKTPELNFIIMRSVSATTVGEDRIFERSARLRGVGLSEDQIEKSKGLQKLEAKRSDEKVDRWVELFNAYKSESWFEHVYGITDPLSQTLIKYRVWYATIVDFDPIPYLEQSSVPIFWIFGDPDLDLLGPVNASIENINRLKDQGKDFTVLQIDGEGHNVKESKYRNQLKEWLIDLGKL